MIRSTRPANGVRKVVGVALLFLVAGAACGAGSFKWTEANKKTFAKEVEKLGGSPELAKCVTDEMVSTSPDGYKSKAAGVKATGKAYQKCGTPFGPQARKEFAKQLQGGAIDAAMAECITGHLAEAYPSTLPPASDPRYGEAIKTATGRCVPK